MNAAILARHATYLLQRPNVYLARSLLRQRNTCIVNNASKCAQMAHTETQIIYVKIATLDAKLAQATLTTAHRVRLNLSFHILTATSA